MAQAAIGSSPGELNDRQLEVIRTALAVPDTRFTVRQLSGQFRITLQTARKDLHELAGLGYLSEGRQGREVVWVADPGKFGSLKGPVAASQP